MSRSLAYFITLLSLVLFAFVIIGKYTAFHVPVVGDMVNENNFVVMIVAYVLLLIPSIFR